jgi:NRPS condensation-like uncharacterized protein
MTETIGRKEAARHIPATANDQWNYLLKGIWDQMIHLLISFEGQCDEETLDRAVRLALDAEPLTLMKFVEGNVPQFTGSAPDPGMPVYSVVRTPDPERTLALLLAKPVDPAKGPLARIRLIRSDHDLLCISLNHTITDAYGVKSFGSLIARLYRSLTNQTRYIPLENLHDRSFGRIFSHFSAEDRERACRQFQDREEVWSFPVSSLRKGARCYERITLDTAEFMRIRENAHNRGFTINDLLLSAFALALGESAPAPPGTCIPVLTSIDLRRYLPPDAYPSLANLSVAFEVPIRLSSSGTTISAVNAAMARRKIGYAGIGAAENLCRTFDAGYLAVKRQLASMERETEAGLLGKNPFFSNLGVIPEGILGFGIPVRTAWMLPPVQYPPGFGLAASTCQGRLTLSAGFCREAIEAERVSSILSSMARHLPGFPSGK